MFNTIPQKHAAVVQRFGKFSRVQDQGLRFTLPFIEAHHKVIEWGEDTNKEGWLIELSEQTSITPPRTVHTKDNVEVKVNSSIYWRIVNVEKSIFEVDNLPIAIKDSALNALRSIIGQMELNDVLTNRQKVNDSVYTSVSETFKKWGVQLSRVEIQELEVNNDAAKAMLQQMEAERRKVALIAESEGIKQSDIIKAEGNATALITVAKAQAEALNIITKAESEYLNKLKEQVGEQKASEILIANKYLENMKEISNKPANKVFIPNSYQGVFGMDSVPTQN